VRPGGFQVDPEETAATEAQGKEVAAEEAPTHLCPAQERGEVQAVAAEARASAPAQGALASEFS
jgi:hypothetical protein